MDRELASLTDIAGGILEAHIGIVLDTDRDDRRIVGQDVEEAERASIRLAILAHCRHQRNRARDHGSDQELVTLPLIELGEIKMGVVGHIRPRQQCGAFQAECGGRGSQTHPW